MMFWRFGFHVPSAINSILDRPDITLEELFAEDDLLQESKGQNAKLASFLVDNVEKLVYYAMTGTTKDGQPILAEDFDQPEHLSDRKNAYLSCEIIGAEISSLLSTIAQPQHLEVIFKFLETDLVDNTLLLNHFGRITQVLIQRQPQAVFDYLRSKLTLHDVLLANIRHSAVANTIIRIATAPFSGLGSSYLTQNEFSQKLVQLLASAEDPEVISNISNIYLELLAASNSGLISDEFIQYLFDKERLALIFKTVFSKDSPVATSGIKILISYLDIAHKFKPESPDQVSSFESCFIQYSNEIYESLVTSNNPELPLSFGKIVPLGPFRLLLCDFLGRVLQNFRSTVANHFAEPKLLKAVVDLFFQYPFHSLLHSLVSRMIKAVIEREYEELYEELLVKSELVSRIYANFPDTHIQESSDEFHRHGYCGYLTMISNLLESKKEQLSPHLGEGWTEFAQTRLAKQNEVEKPAYQEDDQGDQAEFKSPRSGDDDGDDDNVGDLDEYVFFQVYSNFTSAQILTFSLFRFLLYT
eukprot:TRINITY_DN1166_c0_g2_i2.p1 TRINITY_DN1166_c0_g2~~TRINITY_DN1166_c0_g2_i2.p1  ORF type:complete len:528 (-),score=117.70 TRINITY_DN1166_c0_g2_i2:1184-2767(-)